MTVLCVAASPLGKRSSSWAPPPPTGAELLGNYMYPADTYLRLLALIRAGLLDLRPIQTRTFGLDALPAATMDAAAVNESLECIVVTS